MTSSKGALTRNTCRRSCWEDMSWVKTGANRPPWVAFVEAAQRSQADVHKSLEHGWCSHGALRVVGRTMQICQVINRRCKPHMMKFYTGLRGNEGSKARRADWSRNCFWEEGGWVLSKMWEDPDNVMVIWRHWRRRATHSKNHVERTDMAPPTQDPLKSKQFTFLRFA